MGRHKDFSLGLVGSHVSAVQVTVGVARRGPFELRLSHGPCGAPSFRFIIASRWLLSHPVHKCWAGGAASSSPVALSCLPGWGWWMLLGLLGLSGQRLQPPHASSTPSLSAESVDASVRVAPCGTSTSNVQMPVLFSGAVL